MQGRIVKGVAGFYDVYVENAGTYVCKAKGIFRKDNKKPLVGDYVTIQSLSEQDMEGNITGILPRQNALIRPQVANVDQTLLIFALKSPLPNYLLLDKLILQYKQQDIPILLCFNKEDLVEDADVSRVRSMYEKCGCTLLFTSVKSGEGIAEVKSLLKGKTTTVAGPSGVGKSSLINCLQTDREMETGDLSRKVSRGKHTTRHSEIIPVGNETYIMDTPGFTSYDVTGITCDGLQDYYTEFAEYADCYFQPCSHIHEPDCGVRAAVDAGRIPQERYEHYIEIYRELKERAKRNHSE
ncbi:MAG: ribosome small subunit-dependent GTPase A [Lachnospiraceae bacterium]|nr:ribosome small subunit-dependent GTPase A [Parasporobacterium sp.]MBR4169814.1 ribosome small subunit-dependent GTPase A [Lachnospiraceae bacterium]